MFNFASYVILFACGWALAELLRTPRKPPPLCRYSQTVGPMSVVFEAMTPSQLIATMEATEAHSEAKRERAAAPAEKVPPRLEVGDYLFIRDRMFFVSDFTWNSHDEIHHSAKLLGVMKLGESAPEKVEAPPVSLCPGDALLCLVGRDTVDAHWRCGTSACGQRDLHR